MFCNGWNRVLLVVLISATASVAQADVFNMDAGLTSLETVAVGNVGNTADATTYGNVGYAYQIGKYEITAAQYAEFLNAVASDSDTYGLYNTLMSTNDYGCKIERTESAGSYSYSVSAANANRPVNFVSWFDAIRFANWLQNGQGTVSTESGVYTITGGGANSGTVSIPDAVARGQWTSSHWVLASENEWYKAAYHQNDDVTGNYWKYPTAGNAKPGTNTNDTTGNNANYGTTTWLTTVVGEYELSDSAYGTFDQGGNVMEWTESLATRGGALNSSYSSSTSLSSSDRTVFSGSYEAYSIGFRVASVPEPSSIALLAVFAITGLLYRRCRA